MPPPFSAKLGIITEVLGFEVEVNLVNLAVGEGPTLQNSQNPAIQPQPFNLNQLTFGYHAKYDI